MTHPSPAAIFETIRAANAARRKGFDLAARRAALRRLRDWIRAHEADICAAVAQDMGKSEVEAQLTEILPCLTEIAHTSRHLRAWMAPRRAWPTLFMLGTSAAVHPEAKGVVLVIAPWNFPFQLAVAPMAQALAAGNGVVVKPSEMTPATSALIARMAAEVFAPDLVQVVEGGADASTALLELPFDHIFFTGSPAVGRIVMAAAAKHLTSVTLELGGKSPVVVGQGADVAQAAKWIAWGKVLNSGQICVAPDHVFAHESLIAPLSRAIATEVKAMAGGGVTRIVNDRHYARLTRLIEDARAKGAQVETLGDDRPETRHMATRLLMGLSPEMDIAGEEIFGPLLPLIPFASLDEPIAAINAGPKPLTVYGFGDRELDRRLRTETASGTMAMNLTVLGFSHQNLPFGGVGNSGIGAGHGKAGFDGFSHLKPVLKNRFTLMPLLFPPYGGRVRKLVRAMIGLAG